MPLIRRGSAREHYRARVAWLKPQLDRYADVPGIRDDVTDANRGALDALCVEMAQQGLFGSYARGRPSKDHLQRETVRRLLSELRGEDVGVGW